MEYPVQCFLGLKKPTKKEFDKITNMAKGMNKPCGGLWTSSYFKDKKCGWEEWIEKEEFDEDKYAKKWIVTINKDVKVLTIDSHKDMEKAYEDFPFLGDRLVPELDYEKIAKKYDIVHLTENGFKECNLGEIGKYIPTFKFLMLTFDSWDCESSLILNWKCIETIKEHKEYDV